VPQAVSAFSNRDIQFLWSDTYASIFHTPLDSLDATTLENDLDRYGKAICQDFGANPMGLSTFSDIRVVHDYLALRPLGFRDSVYSTNPALIGFRVNQPTYPDAQRNHIDCYVPAPAYGAYGGDGDNHDRLPSYPSSFRWYTEDGSAPGDPVSPNNSIDIGAGPLPTGVGDTTPSRWTSPTRLAIQSFDHEFEHCFNDNQAQSTHLFATAAEVISGLATAGVQYFDAPFTTGVTTDPNYEGWESFTAYLAYNFRGTSLSDFRDDLLSRWASGRYRFPADTFVTVGRTLSGLGLALADGPCAECASLSYFSGLAPHERVMTLLHNWRIANYVDNYSFAEHQYGFNPAFGFKPSTNLRLWRNNDSACVFDSLALPMTFQATRQWLTRGIVASRRLDSCATRLRKLRPEVYGAYYFVVHANTELAASTQDLILRISPDSLLRRGYVQDGGPCQEADYGASLMVSVVTYSSDSDSLYLHPELMTDVVTKKVDADSLAGWAEFVIPSFGQSTKAVVIVVSVVEGPAGRTPPNGLTGTLPIRFAAALRGGAYQATNPLPVAETQNVPESEPTWAPTGDEIAFVRDDPGTGHRQIMRKGLAGGSASLVLSRPYDQYQPDWSPRGDWIAFVQDDSLGGGAIWIANPSTGAFSKLPTPAGYLSSPVFQPNGQRLAYLRARSGTGVGGESPVCDNGCFEVRRTNLDGTGDVALTTYYGEGNVTSLRWSPDGRWLYLKRSGATHAVAVDGGTPVVRDHLAPNAESFDLHLGQGPMAIAEASSYDYTKECHDESNTCCTFGAPSVPMSFVRIALYDTVQTDIDPQFYRTGAEFHDPRWAPEGTRLAYTSTQNGTGADVLVGQVSYDHAPTMAVADQTLTQGVPFTLALSANDVDGDAITYVAPSLYLPPGSTFGGNTFSWSNPGPSDTDYYVVFRALDPNGGLANRVVKIRVAGGGGGGCPFADTRTATGWQVENSLLGRSLDGALAEDFYRLKQAPEVVGGTVRIRIREDEREVTTLDQIQLVAIDHDAGTRVFSGGGRVVAGSVQAPYRVKTSTGEDVTQRSSGGIYYEGQPGETLYVDLAAPGRGGASAEHSVMEDEEEGGGVLNGFQKDPGEENVRQGIPGAPLAQSEDMRVIDGSGILVQVPDDAGGWREVRHYYPRENADDCVVDSVGSKPMRLIFLAAHKLTIVGRLVGATEASRTLLELRAARHSRLGDVRNAVASSGGATTLLANGDTLSLEFAATSPAQGLSRDYFLISNGVYTTATPASQRPVRGDALPTAFSLAQNQPNPFSQSTEISFALPVPSTVTLEIFDLAGRRVAVLADQTFIAGFHKAPWNRAGRDGSVVPPGVYLYRIRAGRFVEQKKMVLLPK